VVVTTTFDDPYYALRNREDFSARTKLAKVLYFAMTEPNTHRSNCRFLVQDSGGKPVVVVQLFQDTIPMLKDLTIGFDLLGGTQPQQAKRIAELLNEQVLNLFVSVAAKG